ncbi:MAG: carboxypeptidase-like regulatory domain-containing protein, partial [Saprospiraceae bacterium]
MHKKLIVGICCMFLSALGFAQNGTLIGKIFDKSNGEELIGATVMVKGSDSGTVSDIDGTFALELAPGVYSIISSYVSYQEIEITNIEIIAGKITTQDFGLSSGDGIDLKEVVVTSRKLNNTEHSLLMMQKKMTSVINAISPQEITRNGDS